MFHFQQKNAGRKLTTTGWKKRKKSFFFLFLNLRRVDQRHAGQGIANRASVAVVEAMGARPSGQPSFGNGGN